jgi:type IV secretory pathway component VirB8
MSYYGLFDQKRDGHHNDNNHYDDHRDGRYENQGGHEQYRYILDKLKNSKKLLVVLSVVAIVIVMIVIAVIIMFVPLIMKLLAAVQSNGIGGLIESVKSLLGTLWSGTGK